MTRRRAAMAGVAVASLLVTACSTTTVVVVPPSTAAGTSASLATETQSSPTSLPPSSPPTLDDAAAAFALELQSTTGQTVRYAVIEAEDLKQGKEWAPDLVVDFPDAPKSFNGWQAWNDLLVGGGAATSLQANGFTSYGMGVPGSTIQFAIDLDDAAKVPGPRGHSVTHLVLTRAHPKFVNA
jgi:hypothetical protein